ncbi:MAG: flagellar motor protein [Deltaproteobacteria bacterium]|nr:flagellar motor protein [Deltaproteobacteria bacterium]
MDFASIAGLLLAIGAILGGQALEGGHIGSIAQPTAALIVVGGTIGAVAVSFPGHALKAAIAATKTVFKPHHVDYGAVAQQLIGFATQARQNGIIAIEKSVAELSDPFLKKALNLAVDGTDGKAIRSTMELDLAREEEEAEAPAKVYEAAGGFAPTVGILGAVLGLIHVMENLSDPSKLGSGIAVAFVATVYGVGLANLFVLPMASKLKMRAAEHARLRELMIEGVVAIVDGENPRLIKEKLAALSGQAMDGEGGDKAVKKAA